MPYIKKERRKYFDSIILQITGLFDVLYYKAGIESLTSGDLNYLITSILHKYIEVKGERYQNYNDVIGVLECAKQELYRRKIASYEDKKIKENGDVF